MALVYRSEKGAPLTSSEIDGNFKELETRLKTLEENPETGEGIGKIQVQQDHISFIGTFGANFGSFPLPKARVNLCGTWQPQTLYQKLDVVSFKNALYSCLRDHTSTALEKDKTHWKEILSFPKPQPSSFPIYEKSTLPMQEILGTMVLLMEKEGPSLIFFNGKTWQRITKGDPL